MDGKKKLEELVAATEARALPGGDSLTISFASIRSISDAFKAMEDENADLDQTFDLRWKADQRAVERWQKETGKTLTWPDHADLVVWLLEKLDAAHDALRPFADFAQKAEQFVEGTARSNGSPIMPTKDFRLSDFRRAAEIIAETEGSRHEG